jgi:hypothetical protein
MVVALLVILLAIARFYQITSGQSSHYRWFGAPIALLSVGALRYALLGDFVGDALGDVLMLIGSVALTAQAWWLLRLMTGGRR